MSKLLAGIDRKVIRRPPTAGAQWPPMPVDETSLFEEFVRARQQAVELTDWYREAPADAPDHDHLWEQVVRQTEEARALLETWLAHL